MKNKFENDFSSEKLVKENFTIQRSKSSNRRESTPIIVVCPPMEDTLKSSTEPRRGRTGRRLTRQTLDENSMKSSSSNDSMGENRSEDNSCSASDTSSDGSERPRRHRSSVSLRKLFESLTMMTRSQSSSPSDRNKPKKAPPKRLLRTPVTYTYVRGLSGLPTQRVPRHMAYQYVT